ncbi:unnamed protein product [Amoebophrya sp. A120]|nr:unnamed protein product [Amoebophrya sp. A120]|eukprot:GSA120T00024947001.1
MLIQVGNQICHAKLQFMRVRYFCTGYMSGWNNYNDISCIPADGETFRQKSQFSIVEQHRLRFSPNFGGGGSEENLSPSIHSLNSSQDTQMRIGIRTPLVSQDSEYNSTSRDNSPRRTGGTSSMAVEVDNINNSKAGTTSRPSPRAGGTTAAGASYRMFSHRYANRLIEDHDSAMKDGTTRQMNQSANNNNQLLSVALLNAISENTNDIEDDSDMHTPNSENKNSTSRSRQVSASSASLRNRNLYLDSLDSSDEGGGTNSNSLSFNASGSFGDSTLGKNKTSQQFFDFSPPQTRGSNAGTSASVQSFLGAGGVGGPQAQPQVEDRENISMMNF